MSVPARLRRLEDALLPRPSRTRGEEIQALMTRVLSDAKAYELAEAVYDTTHGTPERAAAAVAALEKYLNP